MEKAISPPNDGAKSSVQAGLITCQIWWYRDENNDHLAAAIYKADSILQLGLQSLVKYARYGEKGMVKFNDY